MHWTVQRRRMRAILNGSKCVRPASVFDPISARIAELAGFEVGMYAGSLGALTALGAPERTPSGEDLSIITLSEFAQQAYRICRATAIPVMADAGAGYGNALNVMRANAAQALGARDPPSSEKRSNRSTPASARNSGRSSSTGLCRRRAAHRKHNRPRCSHRPKWRTVPTDGWT